MLRFREFVFAKNGSCFLSPTGKIFGTNKKDIGDNTYGVEHKWFIKDNLKIFGFTKEDLNGNSAGDLLETAICNGWITARWGAPPPKTKRAHAFIWFRVSVLNKVRKRLEKLLIDLMDVVGNDPEISIEEYGTVPFKNMPKNVFSGSPEEFFRESHKGNKKAQILKESVLDDAAVFYDAVRTELHGRTGVDIWSDEPIGSNFSCFDYELKGSDWRDDKEIDRRFVWKECALTMDDDGLYWESREGKKGSLLIYGIRRIELMQGSVKVWTAPAHTSDQMAVVEFIK